MVLNVILEGLGILLVLVSAYAKGLPAFFRDFFICSEFFR